MTHDPQALFAAIGGPTTLWIGGSAVNAADGSTMSTVNPATGQTLAEIAVAGPADVDAAVAAARRALTDGPWPTLEPTERRRLLLRFASLVEAHADELAMLETLESGKPIHDTSTIDLPVTVACLRWHAEMADKWHDQIAPSGPGTVSMIVREPIGVVAAVLPWNYPLMMAAWKIGPALATGNTLVLKPAEETSMATLRLGELASEAGLPDGVLNIVSGPGEITGRALGEHPDVDCVAFTGSTEVGRMFLRYAADSNLKRVLLECGGKSPMVVMADAEDLDAVAAAACEAIVWNAGQNCSANSRLIVHRSLADDLLARMDEVLHEWVVGDPLDPETRVGAIITADQLDRMLGYVERAEAGGAVLRRGGRRLRTDSGGWFMEPTIFDEVAPDAELACDEVFGPVLAVTRFDHADEAIALANATPYGLHASVFTSNVRTAHLAAARLRAGTVSVNTYSEGNAATPFGGYGLSGFGGRDNGLASHEQYTETKTVWLDLGAS